MKRKFNLQFNITDAMQRCAQAYVNDFAEHPNARRERTDARTNLHQALMLELVKANPEWRDSSCLIIAENEQGDVVHAKVPQDAYRRAELSRHFFSPWLAPMCHELGLFKIPSLCDPAALSAIKTEDYIDRAISNNYEFSAILPLGSLHSKVGSRNNSLSR